MVEEPETTPDGGTPPPSATPVTVLPAPLGQTVDFGSLVDPRYADAGSAAASAVTASALSVLAETLSTTTPAVCVGSGTSLLVPGYSVCTVISHEESDSYLAGPPVA